MKLWITYAWKDNEEGNFDYFVQQLNNFGIYTEYDKIAIIPGQRLWAQIADKIMSSEITGWAYLITPNSLASEACKEELSYAMNRVLENKTQNFPVIGLVTNGVSFEDIPVALKVRLCVKLSDPDWKEQVKAALEGQPAKNPNKNNTRFIYNITQNFDKKGTTIIEVRPRFEEFHFWRIALPSSSKLIRFGVGPANTNQLLPMLTMMVEGIQGNINGVDCQVVGAGDKLTPGTSAYILVNDIPDFIAIGQANEPLGVPSGPVEIMKLK